MNQPAHPLGPVTQPQPAHRSGPPPPPNDVAPYEVPGLAADADDAAALEDDDLLADRRVFRPTRLTIVLLTGILAAVAFGGGVLVQKHWGTSSSAAATPGGRAFGAGAGATGRTGGFGGQAGYGGFGGQTGQAGAGAPGAPGAQAGSGQAASGTAQSGGAATSSTSPVVVGTITKISGNVLSVKNFGGTSVEVTVPEGATVTLVAGSKLTGLEKGSNVSVAGTKNSDGSVKATVVTVTSS